MVNGKKYENVCFGFYLSCFHIQFHAFIYRQMMGNVWVENDLKHCGILNIHFTNIKSTKYIVGNLWPSSKVILAQCGKYLMWDMTTIFYIFTDSLTMIIEDAQDPFIEFLDDVTAFESLNLNFSQADFFPSTQAEGDQLDIVVKVGSEIVSCMVLIFL